MTTLTKIIVTTLLSFLLFSCNFDMNFTGVKGNGNVQIEDRTVQEPFTAIEASHGLDVFLSQATDVNIVIEADENLHELIKTDVKNNVLRLYTEKNIGYAKSKKVMVNFESLSKISSTSGSDVTSTNTISADHLELSTSSGSDMQLDVKTTDLDCNSSSGSDLTVSGTTVSLIANASSGANIKAGDLVAESSRVKASSGADVTVNTAKELTAWASSGGDIKYYGNPGVVNTNDSPSGSIRKQ